MLMDDGYTNNERSAAEELGLPVEVLRVILDTYVAHCRNDANRRREISRKRLEDYGLEHPTVD